MKVILINSRCGTGSTGRICVGIANVLQSSGHQAYIAYGLGKSTYKNSFKFANRFEVLLHTFLARLTDREGLFSYFATKRLIKYISQVHPDVVNIHTIHGSYVNYPMLFRFLKKEGCEVAWTLHDCWSFTGHCAHFYECQKWKVQCYDCPHIKEYPKSYFIDNSKTNYKKKKFFLTQLGSKLTIVAVSNWLGGLVESSFLKNARIEVIQNGIDTDLFRIIDKPRFKLNRGLQNKIVLLGVALPWSQYKGLKDFFILRKMLSDKYVIVLVGLDEEQKNMMEPGMIGLGRTDSIEELVDIYNSADLFINPTYQDTFPTVNLEAMACGTPVITYKTGGSPESITVGTGLVVTQGDTQALYDAIVSYSFTKAEKMIYRENVIQHFDKDCQFMKYVELFESLN